MSRKPEELSRTQIANAIAERTADAYSADRYRSWKGVATALLSAGYDERQTEAIMRSKWARWAADGDHRAYGEIPAKVLVEYAEKQSQGDLNELTRETFESHAEGKPATRPTRTMPSRSVYTEAIRERLIKMGRDRGLDPRHIEAYMRLEHPTLDGLDRASFTREVAIAAACIDASSEQENESLARSFGL